VGVGVAGLAVDLRDVGGAASLMVGAGAVVGLQREQRDPMPLGDQREQRDEARRDPTRTEIVLLLLLLVQELDPRVAHSACAQRRLPRRGRRRLPGQSFCPSAVGRREPAASWMLTRSVPWKSSASATR